MTSQERCPRLYTRTVLARTTGRYRCTHAVGHRGQHHTWAPVTRVLHADTAPRVVWTRTAWTDPQRRFCEPCEKWVGRNEYECRACGADTTKAS